MGKNRATLENNGLFMGKTVPLQKISVLSWERTEALHLPLDYIWLGSERPARDGLLAPRSLIFASCRPAQTAKCLIFVSVQRWQA